MRPKAGENYEATRTSKTFSEEFVSSTERTNTRSKKRSCNVPQKPLHPKKPPSELNSLRPQQLTVTPSRTSVAQIRPTEFAESSTTNDETPSNLATTHSITISTTDTSVIVHRQHPPSETPNDSKATAMRPCSPPISSPKWVCFAYLSP